MMEAAFFSETSVSIQQKGPHLEDNNLNNHSSDNLKTKHKLLCVGEGIYGPITL
jgi:hypothetical protein